MTFHSQDIQKTCAELYSITTIIPNLPQMCAHVLTMENIRGEHGVYSLKLSIYEALGSS